MWVKKGTVIDGLMAEEGVSRDEASRIAGAVSLNPWVIVDEPFQREFLPDRRWNRYGAQLAVQPAAGTGPFHHPSFDLIFQHCGAGLDEVVKDDAWCKKHNIKTGKQYLLFWASSLFQRPKQRLPFLFFFSKKQDNGKSAFHRCLGLLMDGGYVSAKHALCEDTFNGQLAGAILCYVDEEELPKKAYGKIKNLVDAPFITIRMMNTNAFDVRNYTHWVQSENVLEHCPISAEDERIVMVHVPILTKIIPWDGAWDGKDEDKKPLELRLTEEAPAFLATLLQMELPPPDGRLFLPVLDTPLKQEAVRLQHKAAETTTDINSLAAAVLNHMRNRTEWSGTSTALLKAVGDGPWPNGPSQFSAVLAQCKAPLQQRRFELIMPKDEYPKALPCYPKEGSSTSTA